MGRIAKALSALEVGRLSGAGYHAVGTVPGLHLQIASSGARSWVLRVVVGGKRREMGLGAYPAVTLTKAHEASRDIRALVAEGIDPVAQRRALRSELLAKQAQEMTFKAAAAAYIKAKTPEWKNGKHAQQWTNTLATYAEPVIGNLNVRDVTLSHVLKVLEPIWTEKNETASRVRNRIELVLDWAKVRGHRSGENPAAWGGNLDKLLPRPSKVAKVENHPAVQVAQFGAFMSELRQHTGTGSRALEFLALTASRTNEVLGATWDEIDLHAKVWTVPAARMKGGRPHRVPLTDPALALLHGLPRMAETTLVFPGTKLCKGQAGQVATLSNGTLSAMMRRMGFCDRDGRLAVPHGLRSTFRDWAGERTSYPPDVAEAALAHVRGDKAEASYYRSDLFDKRCQLMKAWAAFASRVEKPTGQVVGLHQRIA